MKHNQVTALLFACLVILSFMCYQQAKTITRMEKDIDSLEFDLGLQEDKINDLEHEIGELTLAIDTLREDIEDGVYYRQSFIKRR